MSEFTEKENFNDGYATHYGEMCDHLRKIIAMCGNPDPAQGCRNIIEYCKELID